MDGYETAYKFYTLCPTKTVAKSESKETMSLMSMDEELY